MTNDPSTTVLVTGGGGFIGSRCVQQLLLQGYTVRTTVRSLTREDELRRLIIGSIRNAKKSGSQAGSCDHASASAMADARLSFYEADLLSDRNWAEATTGCKYVLHVASPLPSSPPKDENEVIKPAVEGTLRVLKAAMKAGVTRVVLTSSWGAVGYGHTDHSRTLDETDWSDTSSEAKIGAYVKSKTLAEKAAWRFVEEANLASVPSSASPQSQSSPFPASASHARTPLELSVINPVAVFGPILGPESGRDLGFSISFLRKIASGGLPVAPRMAWGIVDVRDVVALHLIAMTHPKAAGERFIAISDEGSFHYMQEIAKACGKEVPNLPDWVVKLGAYVSSDMAIIAGELGNADKGSNAKAREMLGYEFVPWQESITATLDSLREHGLLE